VKTGWPQWLLHLGIACALAYCLESALRGWSYRRLEPARYRVEAVPAQKQAHQGRLALRNVLADGTLVRFRGKNVPAGWVLRQEDGGVPGHLETPPGDKATAVLEIPAVASIFAEIDAVFWAGEVRVFRDGQLAGTFPVAAGSPGQYQALRLGSPATRASMPLRLLFFGLLFGIGAAARRYCSRWPSVWLTIALGIGHLCYWLCVPVGYQGDTNGYWDTVRSLASGSPTFQPPGYSIQLGLVAAITGEGYLARAITLLQHAMAVVALVWLFLMLRRLMHPDVAFAAAFLIGLTGPVLAASQNVLTEWPTAFAMVGAVYLSFLAAELDDPKYAVLAGVLAGWSGLLRVVPMAGLIPTMAAMIWFSPSILQRRRLVLVACASGAAMAVVLGMVTWYGYHGQGFRLSRSTGYHLYNRAIFDQKLLDPIGPSTRKLTALMPDRDFRNSWNWEVSDDPRVQHIPWDELEMLVRQTAMEAIRANPRAFALYTPKLAWKLYAVPTSWLPKWGGTLEPHPVFERPPVLPFTVAGFDWIGLAERINARTWPVACWLALLALPLYWRHPERRIVLAMTLAPALYLMASATVAVFAARYNAPAVVLVYGLAVLPLYWVVRWVERLWHGKPQEAVMLEE